ncbi:hypothetical protein HYPSUDRAFT_737617 [Hypholoma sublateritium FD-334 SS-4]|uniref:Uncharacterized protein n=1 Tax=Hypholoma sublateritium (strain FD-334 SS-4) TaxID=945553 RepID=A0A0D2L3T2_HYPSF|nr:hypothetical protein HYPSUDRAFT_737617 [Hypholoma sublateritium FD-334 SS-4]
MVRPGTHPAAGRGARLRARAALQARRPRAARGARAERGGAQLPRAVRHGPGRLPRADRGGGRDAVDEQDPRRRRRVRGAALRAAQGAAAACLDVWMCSEYKCCNLYIYSPRSHRASHSTAQSHHMTPACAHPTPKILSALQVYKTPQPPSQAHFPMADRGLLFVYGEIGPKVPEAEFSDWYDNEHGPARLTVPGFTKAARYKATDGAAPTWLAVYDLSSAAIGSSAPYKALVASATPRDIDIIARAQSLDRRVYDLINVVASPAASTFPTQFALVVTFRVQPELDAEFNKWYDEEHIPQLSAVPGFVRVRRFKLVDRAQIAGPAPPAEATHNYLTLYDTDRDDYHEQVGFKAALVTPWTTKIVGAVGVGGLEIRRFGLHKELHAPAA